MNGSRGFFHCCAVAQRWNDVAIFSSPTFFSIFWMLVRQRPVLVVPGCWSFRWISSLKSFCVARSGQTSQRMEIKCNDVDGCDIQPSMLLSRLHGSVLCKCISHRIKSYSHEIRSGELSNIVLSRESAQSNMKMHDGWVRTRLLEFNGLEPNSWFFMSHLRYFGKQESILLEAW